jgi:hypothetical protein
VCSNPAASSVDVDAASTTPSTLANTNRRSRRIDSTVALTYATMNSTRDSAFSTSLGVAAGDHTADAPR